MGIITTRTAQGQCSEQEDRFIALSCEEGHLLAVCDGHRGHQTAAQAIAQLIEFITAAPLLGALHVQSEAQAFLRKIVEHINRATCKNISGSTFSLVYISELKNRVDIAILGDSPVIVKQGTGRTWVSPAHNVRRNEADARRAEERGGHIQDGYLCAEYDGAGLQLTRALGDRDLSRVLDREAEYFSFALDAKSVVALLSDGVYDEDVIFTEEDLASLPLTSADAIVADALARGSRDNVTAILWRAQ